MKTPWIRAGLLAAALALPSHAILGLGFHYAPAPGVEVSSSRGLVSPAGANDSISIDLKGVSGLQGFGLKFWIDVLPLIDLEAAANVQFGYYDVDFLVNGNRQSLDFDLGIPGVDGRPFFARTYADVAVLYPFFKLPMIKLQAGGGLTFGAGTPVLNAAFARKALTRAQADGDYDPNGPVSANDIATIFTEAIEDEGMVSGAGIFLQAGVKVKPPLIPLAAYADAKYRFAGYRPDGVGGADLGFELGAALAF